MSLRTQTLLILTLVLTLLVTVLYFTAEEIFRHNTTAFETQSAVSALARVRAVVENEFSQLDTTLHDWSSWDDTYAFIAGTKPEHVTDNFTNTAFQNLHLSLVAILDANGKIVYGAFYNPATDTLMPLPDSLASEFIPENSFIQSVSADSPQHGLFRTEYGVLMLAARSVLMNNDIGPANGVQIFGRMLDQETTDNLARLGDLPLDLILWDDPRAGTLRQAYPVLSRAADAQIIFPLNDNQLLGLLRLNDIHGNPIMLARLDLPRDAYQSARAALNVGLVSLLVIGAVLIGSVIFVSERLVLNPLASLTRQVQQIGARDDFSKRVQIHAHKELNATAESINTMLDALEESRRAIAAEQARYQAIVQDQTEWIIRFVPDGVLTFANVAFCHAFGIAAQAWQGINWFDLLPERAVQELKQACAALAETDVVSVTCLISVADEKSVRHAWVLRRIPAQDGTLAEIQGVGEDVSVRLATQEKLQYLGTHDALTGLYNRAYFEQQLALVESGAQFPTGLLIADLDELKLTNDRYGHAAGDVLLTVAARVLRESFRAQDIVARMGGDEFAVLLPHTSADAIREIVRRLDEHILAHNATAEPVIKISIGYATAQNAAELQSALLQADTKMYEAKFSHRPVAQLENVLGIKTESEIFSWLATQDAAARAADNVLTISRAAQMERALRESETRYRALLELLPVITYVVSSDRTAPLLFAGREMETLLGYSIQEWLTRPGLWLECIHAQDRERVRALVEQAQQTDEVFEAEYRMVSRTGAIVWVRDRARVVRLEQSALLHGVLIDLTERKETEARLARQNQELDMLFNLTTVMNQNESEEITLSVAQHTMAELLNADHVSILLYDAAGELQPRTALAEPDALAAHVRACLPWTRTASEPHSMWIADVQAEQTPSVWRAQVWADTVRALGLVPLVKQDELLGVLVLAYDAPRAFTTQDNLLAQTIANQTAAALARIQAQAALETANQEMSGIFNAVPDLYFRLANDGMVLACRTGARNEFLGVSQNWSGRNIRNVFPGYVAAQFWSAMQECQNTRASVSLEYELSAPSGEQTYEARFHAIANAQMVVIIRNITARRAAEELNLALTALAQELMSVQTKAQAAKLIAQVSDQLLGWDSFLFVLYSQAENRFVEVVAAYDIVNGVRAPIRLSDNFTPSPLIQRALRENGVIELRADPEMNSPVEHRMGDTNRPSASLLFVPMRHDERVIGVLSVQSYRVNAYDENSLTTLRALADHCGAAFARIQAQEDLRQKNIELELAYDETIAGWARALELRDNETHNHSQRVAEMTLAIARRLGVSEEEIKNMRRGALLHDMGKVGVPDAILHKGGALTPEEKEIMQRHPMYAYEMLKDIAYLAPAMDIPYAHHEWWDGSGYPRGLKGEAIPLAARIFAVVDVWDALTSDRPYRQRWQPAQVRAYLQEKAGTQFDPRIVGVLMELLDENEMK